MIEDTFRSPTHMRRRYWKSDSNDNAQRHRFRLRLSSTKRNVVIRFWLIATLGIIVMAGALCVTWTYLVKHNSRPVKFLRKKKQRRRPVPLDPVIVGIRQQFPQTAREMEAIPHPGILFSGSQRAKILLPGFNFPESLMVPKFWNPPEYGPDGVRHFLGENGQRLITSKEAQSIGSVTKDGKETIFVSLASYRDTECRSTLESIFSRAARPERIRVGVVDQLEPEDPRCTEPVFPCEQDPEQALCRYRHLIDVYEVPSFLMVGPVLARHIAHRMYRGEYYFLQTDAHVRFVQGWDDDIISQWEATDNEMAVITTYLTDIADSIDPLTHASRRKDRNILCHLSYEGNNQKQMHLIMKSPTKSVPKVTGTPMLHPFWSAGFSFSRGHFVVQLPYDPYTPMLFQGEESSLSIRAFSYGYDFYAPERSVCFHMFAIKTNIGRRQRHKFWEHETLYLGALDKSLARIVGITRMAGIHSPQDYFRREEENYGLGKVRPVNTFYATFGIHPDTATIENQLCSFVQKRMHRQLQPFLRSDAMGIDYSKIDFDFRDSVELES